MISHRVPVPSTSTAQILRGGPLCNCGLLMVVFIYRVFNLPGATGLDGTIPTGPNDDIHVANSNTATSPTLEQPNDDTHVINSDAAASLTLTDTITTMQPNPGPQTTNEPEPPQLPPPTERITLDNNGGNGNGPSATTIRGSRKRKYSPAKTARHQALYDQARITRHDADSLENGESNPAVP